jgi:aminoglycoside 6'-N-acetyltransferase I
MHIIPLLSDHEPLLQQAAALLTQAFPHAIDWQTHEGALEEVHNVLAEGVAFAAMSGHFLLGWIGGLNVYNGNTWELHPLVVRPTHQGKGVGRALVEVLENAAREAGVYTIMLGTDDEDFRTSLSQVDDLYTDLVGHIAGIHNLDENSPHPFSFYQKCGYQIVGILPDANGPRRPDIFMAKRIRA